MPIEGRGAHARPRSDTEVLGKIHVEMFAASPTSGRHLTSHRYPAAPGSRQDRLTFR